MEKVLEVASKCPQHRFLFLTKNPLRYREFKFTGNCCTINREADTHRIIALRVVGGPIPGHIGLTTFISFEPLYEEIISLGDKGHFGVPDWVIIGGQTKPTLLPKKEWVERLIRDARLFNARVFLKDNLGEMKAELGGLEEMP